MVDRKRHAMRRMQDFAMDAVAEGATRGLTPADLFGAFAQIVANQNPMLARKSMEALQEAVRSRIPLVAEGPAMPLPGPPATTLQ
jgi:hypothetical protein